MIASLINIIIHTLPTYNLYMCVYILYYVCRYYNLKIKKPQKLYFLEPKGERKREKNRKRLPTKILQYEDQKVIGPQ